MDDFFFHKDHTLRMTRRKGWVRGMRVWMGWAIKKWTEHEEPPGFLLLWRHELFYLRNFYLFFHLSNCLIDFIPNELSLGVSLLGSLAASHEPFVLKAYNWNSWRGCLEHENSFVGIVRAHKCEFLEFITDFWRLSSPKYLEMCERMAEDHTEWRICNIKYAYKCNANKMVSGDNINK